MRAIEHQAHRAEPFLPSRCFLAPHHRGGKNTLVIHNTCEDSLLAAPIILDLVLLAELITRIELRKDGEPAFHGLHPVAVLLSYLTKAPLVPFGTPVVNALSKQRAMLENVMRACIGLAPENNMLMEFKA